MLWVKYRELVRILEAAGWNLARMCGSHHVYRHPDAPALMTLPFGSFNDDVPTGALLDILRKMGLR